MCFYREALAAVSTFENKKKNSMAWNPDLVIGSNLRIAISGYKWVCDYKIYIFAFFLLNFTVDGDGKLVKALLFCCFKFVYYTGAWRVFVWHVTLHLGVHCEWFIIRY